jgi:hypothetical protein
VFGGYDAIQVARPEGTVQKFSPELYEMRRVSCTGYCESNARNSQMDQAAQFYLEFGRKHLSAVI